MVFPVNRPDPVLLERIAQGDGPGVRERLTTVYGQGPRGPGPRVTPGRWARRGLLRGRLRRTCQVGWVDVCERQDLVMMELVLPFVSPRRPVPDTWGERTPLGVAAGDGFLAAVERLLPVSPLTQGQPLAHAAAKNRRTVVQRLLQADLWPQGLPLDTRLPALLSAARGGHLDVLNDLLEQARPTDLQAHAFELLAAPLLHGHLDCLERLIGYGPGEPSAIGETPLMLAAAYGQAACVQRLLKAYDPSHTDHQGRTLLMRAASSGDGATVRAVLPWVDPTVDPRRTDREHGRTALMVAAMAPIPALGAIEALLPYSDPTQRDATGQTAFTLAWDLLDLDDPWSLSDPPPDTWDRLDRLAVHEPDTARVAEVFGRGGPERMPRWARHLDAQALRVWASTSTPELPGRGRSRL